jgi:hypothetical protein
MREQGVREGGRVEGRTEERRKWEGIVADKDAAFKAAISEKDTALADKDAALAEQEALIAELRARLK